MSTEDLKYIMNEIKNRSETEPAIDPKEVLLFIEEQLKEKLSTER
ncbi:hypothetical protein [Evansella tamaricis]|nr:hypothetical protein [Evansella tamaricis]